MKKKSFYYELAADTAEVCIPAQVFGTLSLIALMVTFILKKKNIIIVVVLGVDGFLSPEENISRPLRCQMRQLVSNCVGADCVWNSSGRLLPLIDVSADTEP